MSEAAPQGRFLSRPERTSAPTAAIEEEPQPEPEPAASEPSWLQEVEEAVGDEKDVELAAAILHGTPGAVARILQEGEFGEDRSRLVLAFSEALAGNRERALETARGIEDEKGLDADERRLLEVALGAASRTAVPASVRSTPPVPRAMEMVLLEALAGEAVGKGDHPEAARIYSDLLLNELDAPWEPDRSLLVAWIEAVNEAQTHHRWDPRGEWPSVTLEVQDGDNLTFIRRRFLEARPGSHLSTGQIEEVNSLDGYIHAGQKLRIPTDPVSVRVDLAQRVVLYLTGDEVAAGWEVGIGRPGEETIQGMFTAGEKEKEPMWFPRGQNPVPFGDARNPLGTRWIGWYQDGRKTSYGFHGTNEPDTIGLAASDGCIRFRNHDVERLFRILPLGAPIYVQE